jgi:predicted phage-related endonuclease
MKIERVNIVDREQWLRLRLGNVNASEVAIVLGEGEFGSLAELYAEKKGLRPPRVDTGVLRRGRWGEPAVFEAIAEEFPDWQVTRASIYLIDRERRMGATPDGFASRPDRDSFGIVQAKVISRSVFKRRWLHDDTAAIADGDADAPAYYRLQVLAEMRLSECTWGVLAVLVVSEFDMVLRIFDIEPDIELEASILAGVETFWRDYFDPGIMPPFQPQRDAALIKALYPRDSGAVVDLSGNNRVAELADGLMAGRAVLKRVGASERACAAELHAMLGENTYGKLADGRVVSWKGYHRRAYSVPASNPRVLKILQQMPRNAAGDNADDDADE